jgi:hypothetical protein
MSQLFFADDSQSVRDQDENPGVGGVSSQLYKERKGGPATCFPPKQLPVAFGVKVIKAPLAPKPNPQSPHAHT